MQHKLLASSFHRGSSLTGGISCRCAVLPCRSGATRCTGAARSTGACGNAPVSTDKEVAATQAELIKLLRVSPTLTTVVAHDPSLLSNQDYVARNNPQLAEFLTAHPEVRATRLLPLQPFAGRQRTRLGAGTRSLAGCYSRARESPPVSGTVERPAASVGLCGLPSGSPLEHSGHLGESPLGRIFKLQSEVHGRLIDKFSSNQELALYMETEAGKRFLEAAPIP